MRGFVMRADFDLPQSVTTGQVFRWEEADGLWKGVDGPHRYRVEIDRDHYRVEGGCVESFRRLFRLDLEPERLRAELLKRGSELAPFLDAMEGIRLMRPSCPVETTFSFLCTANNHLARIGPMVRKLASFGEPLEAGEAGDAMRFPATETIAGIPPTLLRERGFGYRAETIVAVAQTLVRRGGAAYLAQLGRADYATAEAELRSLPFVGRKLADCIALYAFDYTEAVPLDTHVWQAVTRLYHPQWIGEALTDLRYRTAAETLRQRFGEYAAFAQQALFLDNLRNWRLRKKSEVAQDRVKS
jgi:N-glycosylase/DNA lyase